MELGLVFTLCGLGAAFLIPALILSIITGSRKKRCSASTTAVVIEIKIRNTVNDGVSYHPVYEYTINGVKYTGLGAFISKRMPQKNSIVPIMYNPLNPKQSYILGYDNKAYRILSIIFTVIGAIPIILCICIAIFT